MRIGIIGTGRIVNRFISERHLLYRKNGLP